MIADCFFVCLFGFPLVASWHTATIKIPTKSPEKYYFQRLSHRETWSFRAECFSFFCLLRSLTFRCLASKWGGAIIYSPHLNPPLSGVKEHIHPEGNRTCKTAMATFVSLICPNTRQEMTHNHMFLAHRRRRKKVHLASQYLNSRSASTQSLLFDWNVQKEKKPQHWLNSSCRRRRRERCILMFKML